MNFKNWLINEISESTILYHRSNENFAVGKILDPSDIKPWIKKFTERKLEQFRKKYAPDAPSRFNCIYCSVVPRSVFVARGNLYEVKPIGKTHVTMAYYINQIDNIHHEERYQAFDKLQKLSDKDEYDYIWERTKKQLLPLFAKYWNVNNINISNDFREDPKWIEVLCEKVVVIKKIDEVDNIFRKDDKIEFTSDMRFDIYGYDSSGNRKLSSLEITNIINHFNGSENKYGDLSLTIPKGTKGKISSVTYDYKVPKKLKSDPYAYRDFAQDIYRFIHIKPDGFDFTITLRSYDDYKKIKKI